MGKCEADFEIANEIHMYYCIFLFCDVFDSMKYYFDRILSVCCMLSVQRSYFNLEHLYILFMNQTH